MDGRAARERYDRYGGGLFPVAWYDLQSFFAARLPPGVLQVASAFECYEPGGPGSPVTVHLRVRAGLAAATCTLASAPCWQLPCTAAQSAYKEKSSRRPSLLNAT